MKNLIFALMFFALGATECTFAQSALEHNSSLEYHQIYLEKPAVELQTLEYVDGLKIEGELSKDGLRIFIKNYNLKNRVRCKVVYEDGEEGEISKSYCYIDPVVRM